MMNGSPTHACDLDTDKGFLGEYGSTTCEV